MKSNESSGTHKLAGSLTVQAEFSLRDAAFVYLSPTGEILDCNERFCSLFSLQKGEAPARLFTERLNKPLFKLLNDNRGNKFLVFRGVLNLKDLTKGIRVSALFLILDNFNPSASGIIGLLDEMTGEGTLSSGQPDYEEHLRIIAENSSESFSLHSPDGNFLYISPSVQKLHGYSADEIVRLGAFHAVHPEDVEKIRELLEQIPLNPDPITIQYRMIHKNGTLIWVESVCHGIRNAEEAVSKISVVTRDITSSKALQELLYQSERKYRSLVKNMPTGVVLLDADGQILEMNEAFMKALDLQEVHQNSLDNLPGFDKHHKSGFTAAIRKCITEKKRINGDTEFLNRFGRRCYLIYHIVPLFDSHGAVSHVIGNIRDITRIRKARERIRQQMEFRNLVLNTMQEPFFVKDEHHRWVMLNDAAVSMMGIPREELLGRTDHDVYPAELADEFWAKDALTFENGASRNEEKIIWSDGSERIIITNKRLYTDKLTGKKFIVGTIHDITELKQTESSLMNSVRKYQELFDNATDFIFTTDIHGFFLTANNALLNRIGISLQDLNKNSVYDYCMPGTIGVLKQAIQELIQQRTETSFEIEIPDIKKEPVILEIQAKLITEQDIPRGIQYFARDVSEKRRASIRLEQYNRELQELNASKDKFFSIIAHDLKSPFNSLLGFSDILQDEFDTLSTDEIRHYIGIIRNTAKNSLFLLENLLGWSRLQAGRMSFNPGKLSLFREVENIKDLMFSHSIRKKISIENLVNRELLVKADKNMIQSVLHNLLMNAVKFTPEGGSITISSARIVTGNSSQAAEPCVKLSVTDTGIGMSQEDISKLFSFDRPFSMPGTEKEAGTGLGLILAREMIEKHGSTLRIVSKPGEGSTFSFQLPEFNSGEE